jgi:hypothetical protein
MAVGREQKKHLKASAINFDSEEFFRVVTVARLGGPHSSRRFTDRRLVTGGFVGAGFRIYLS